ncbi:disease resistance protein Roq1-like [Solanum lycopersicum]|uniref:ADP-ribosyl cyclase/cyclic ADP-ribose hydrolase n=1 Tax=Solanum lycopersicum TaxID=4081 RepID=A0A3Q7G6E6_SOLLC|nr:TMV resistance protein N-like [Solanum lycopersicum]
MDGLAETGSSSSLWPCTYDVFLSFRGEDVRKNFVDHLYTALQQRGIHTFKDDEKLERGKSISPSLFKAIEESMISIIIFSQNYAASSWCLDELVKITQCMKLRGQIVLPVFYDVDPSVVRKQKANVGEFFARHELDFKDDEERVKRWRTAMTEAANVSGWDLPNIANGHESKCIEQVVECVMEILGHTASDATENLVGIRSRMGTVYSLLNLESGKVQFVGIWGMSGIGKTTIARAIYDKIFRYFQGATFLHEVGETSAKHGIQHLQQILLSELLLLKDLRINNVFEGTSLVRRRLNGKRVLIVLDDVNHGNQLDALAKSHDWFGAGSIIIITTKDKQLLRQYNVDKMYKVSLLNTDESIELLSSYAFQNRLPKSGYGEIIAEVVRYAGGLPLALKVLGCSLYGGGMIEWRETVERLKRIPEGEIVEKLKVSFNRLSETDQKIFLDIACFFKGKKKGSVIRILRSFSFTPVLGIRNLIEKSLVTVSKGRIVMHQLIQEMGWHIVRKEASNNLGKYTRLWSPDDILHVLSENKATEAVEGIWLHLPIPKDINVGAEAFKQTYNLRLLKIHNASVSVAPDDLPNKLIWLHWHGYPMKSLPASFQAERLVCLKMQYSRVVHLWKGVKLLHKLKFLNLSHSQKLVSCPDFTGVPNLEKLVLEDCSSIIEIHPSVGYLKNLVLLNLKNCKNLKSLPNIIRLDNLETLILSGCLKLENFPEIMSDMNCLSEVYLEATDVKELPSSIEHLTGLRLMNLGYCRNLTNLPTTIGRLKSLRILILSGCSKLEKLPEELGHIEILEELYCDETAIQSPPSSITLLKNLKTLSFHGCKGMVSQSWSSLFYAWLQPRKHNHKPTSLMFSSFSGLFSLRKLDLSDCCMLDEGIPSDLGCLSSLVELNLSGNNFVDISQASLNMLPRLRILELVGCERLERLPELPTTIEEVFADNCTSLMTDDMGILTNYKMLQRISFTNCVGLLQNQQTRDMATSLWLHLFKKCIVKSGHFSIYLPGEQVPEWFGYKLNGTSVSLQLPNDWYNDKFMGFAICVVSDQETTWLSVHEGYLQEMPGISIEFTIKSHLRRSTSCLMNIGFVGTNKNVASDHTCLAYVAFEEYWSMYKNHLDTPNNWYQIDFSANSLRKHIFLKSWGIRLVYTDDLQSFTS